MHPYLVTEVRSTNIAKNIASHNMNSKHAPTLHFHIHDIYVKENKNLVMVYVFMHHSCYIYTPDGSISQASIY